RAGFGSTVPNVFEPSAIANAVAELTRPMNSHNVPHSACLKGRSWPRPNVHRAMNLRKQARASQSLTSEVLELKCLIALRGRSATIGGLFPLRGKTWLITRRSFGW